MTIRYRVEGFIFKSRPRSESDRVLSVFTKEAGRIEVVGRAIRNMNSKLRGGAELFSFAELEFIQGRAHKTLTDARTTIRFPGVTKDPQKFSIATSISRMADEFIKGQEPDKQILNLFYIFFEKIEQAPAIRNSSLAISFFWNFAVLLGHRPQLYSCAQCHKKLVPRSLYFSASDGGAICFSCASGKRGVVSLSSGALKVLRMIIKQEWSILEKVRLGKEAHELLVRVSKEYYKYLQGTYETTALT